VHARPRPDVSFITAPSTDQPWGRIAGWLGDGLEQHGRRFDRVHLEAGGYTEGGLVRTVALGPLRARAAVPAMVRYLRVARPALAIVAPAQIAPFAILAGRLAGVPVVPWEVTFLSLDLGERKRYLHALPLLQRITYRSAPRIAVVSGDVGDYCLEHFPGLRQSDIFELPNPVDAAAVRAEAAGGAPPSADFRVVAAGRLAHQKGFDLLIKAMSIAASRLERPWQLTILGEGPCRSELGDRIRRSGLDERVRLAGHVANPYREIGGSDLFVHPARWEGFGMVLVEALCLGVPVLATDCPGGPREILALGSAGMLVPSDDPQALAAGIVQAATNPGLRRELADAGAARAEEYAPGQVAGRLLELVDSIGSR
jgi:glycosyltransferase involved in cell wall biosynthesis